MLQVGSERSSLSYHVELTFVPGGPTGVQVVLALRCVQQNYFGGTSESNLRRASWSTHRKCCVLAEVEETSSL